MERYLGDQIYTYIGDILIAVNPFKNLPIYDNEVRVSPNMNFLHVLDSCISVGQFLFKNQVYWVHFRKTKDL